MQKYKAIIEYCGANISGMQIQPNAITIQSIVESALSKLFNEKIKINFAGRTDAGVHAIEQIIDFTVTEMRTEIKTMLGLNFYLKGTNVSCINVKAVDSKFHSRRSSIMRHYVYKIINRTSPLTFSRATHCHVAKQINLDLMNQAGQQLLGTHNFSSFRNPSCQAKSPIRTLENFKCVANGINMQRNEIHLFFSAKSFLHSMVRKMAGALIAVSIAKRPLNYISELLEDATNKNNNAPTAPACGLYMLKIDYPKEYQ